MLTKNRTEALQKSIDKALNDPGDLIRFIESGYSLDLTIAVLHEAREKQYLGLEWTTLEGKKIPVCQLEPDHLENIIIAQITGRVNISKGEFYVLLFEKKAREASV